MESHKSSQQRLTEYALKLLSYRPRSESEIRFRFKRKKITEDQTDQIIHKLKQLKLLDDVKFSQWWQENRDQFRPRSARILKLELRQKGVPEDIIKEVLDTSYEKELKRALNAFNQKFKQIKKEAISQKQREKIIRFLGSRGFPWDIIKQVIDPQA